MAMPARAPISRTAVNSWGLSKRASISGGMWKAYLAINRSLQRDRFQKGYYTRHLVPYPLLTNT
jgi:hypothetical protein